MPPIRAAAKGARACAIVAASILATAGPVAAVEPNLGVYSYSLDDPATSDAVDHSIEFGVRQLSRQSLVFDFEWLSPSCGVVSVPGMLLVEQGQFSFFGKASHSGGKITVKVKGEFSSANAAKVTVKDKDPAYSCERLKRVKVKRQ